MATIRTGTAVLLDDNGTPTAELDVRVIGREDTGGATACDACELPFGETVVVTVDDVGYEVYTHAFCFLESAYVGAINLSALK